jgi:hypothetical protein
MIFSEKYSRTNMIFCQLNLDAFTLPAVASMELNGMLLDREQWRVLGVKLCHQRDSLLKQINSQLHRPNPHQQISLLPEFTDTINPRSPKQVLAALQRERYSCYFH